MKDGEFPEDNLLMNSLIYLENKHEIVYDTYANLCLFYLLNPTYFGDDQAKETIKALLNNICEIREDKKFKRFLKKYI